MNGSGFLSKMLTTHHDVVSYELVLGENKISLNSFVGQTLSLKFTQQIKCSACDRAIPKSYQDGYCFPCVKKLARCDICMVKPELCHHHEGTCREPEWGQLFCMNSHIVYLANVTGVKVGITRKTQVPTRWMDQGALEALPLFEVPHRRVSGYVEVKIAEHIADKTNWRQMLMGICEKMPLQEMAAVLKKTIQNDLQDIRQKFGEHAVKELEDEVRKFEYPVLEYPKKIASLGFDKTSHIEGKLLGIKGQYLIFDKGVLNVRKHSGYEVEFSS